MTFIRKIENFVCENCGEQVVGNGYTNHCPKCLWSKHVDLEPGDRASNCSGMMAPIGTTENGGEWSVLQKCQKCGKIHKNKISNSDNFEILVNLSKNPIQE